MTEISSEIQLDNNLIQSQSDRRNCCQQDYSGYQNFPYPDGDSATGVTSDVQKGGNPIKQNHSEIEKRRRDKINKYITELATMIPMCHAMSRKLDKLTVLRMAVQHLKSVLGAENSYTEVHHKPVFLNDQELKKLILQSAEGFVFVVGCNQGKILYVSESVTHNLNYSQEDLLGQSWFDILHPEDIAKVKEQLSSSYSSPRERLIDAKTMLPVKTGTTRSIPQLCSGARRSFLCRMKRRLELDVHWNDSQIGTQVDKTIECRRDWRYCVVHCTGYLNSWNAVRISAEAEQDSGSDTGSCSCSCLVAVGKIHSRSVTQTRISEKPRLRSFEFVSRHTLDGKFISVDQRVTLVLGYLSQELLGTNMYEYYHHSELPLLVELHEKAIRTQDKVFIKTYGFRSKGGEFVRLQSEWKTFKNPWTREIEYIIAKNSAIEHVIPITSCHH